MKIHFLLISLLLILFSDRVSAKDSKTEVNYVIIEESAEPFQIHNNDGTESGIFTEVVYSVFDKEHYNLKNNVVPPLRFKKILEQFQNKSPQALKRFIAYGSEDWFPKETPVFYSNKPIVTMKSSLIVSKSRNFKFSNITDLFGKTIILIKGFDYPGIEQYLGDGKNQIHELRVKTGSQAIDILMKKNREEIAFIDFEPRAKYQIKQNNFSLNKFIYYDLSKYIKPVSIYLMFSNDFKNNEMDKINEKISTLYNDTTIYKILKKYEAH